MRFKKKSILRVSQVGGEGRGSATWDGDPNMGFFYEPSLTDPYFKFFKIQTYYLMM